MAESTAERTARALLDSLNIVISVFIGLLAAVLYWAWLDGDIGDLSRRAIQRIEDEAFLFRVMWAGIVGVAIGGLAWVIIESVRPTRGR
ncbi:MAG TPA: hypothetical protein VFO84_00635 [Dehalococcoidia bacterium]|nr:hypothetical protein [Dehalococcoidia bacterium]